MKSGWMEKKGKISEMDRSFDIEFWQAQSADMRFEVGWQLVVDYYQFKGKNLDELRLQRTVENLERVSR